jgi:hypothetical protein
MFAASLEDLQCAQFRPEVVSVSRGAGVSTGWFLNVLASCDCEESAAGLADLPAVVEGTGPAPLSFPRLFAAARHQLRADDACRDQLLGALRPAVRRSFSRVRRRRISM